MRQEYRHPTHEVPVEKWAQNGRLTVVDDVEINPHYITDWLKDAKKNYNIRALAIDDFRFALRCSPERWKI